MNSNNVPQQDPPIADPSAQNPSTQSDTGGKVEVQAAAKTQVRLLQLLARLAVADLRSSSES